MTSMAITIFKGMLFLKDNRVQDQNQSLKKHPNDSKKWIPCCIIRPHSSEPNNKSPNLWWLYTNTNITNDHPHLQMWRFENLGGVLKSIKGSHLFLKYKVKIWAQEKPHLGSSPSPLSVPVSITQICTHTVLFQMETFHFVERWNIIFFNSTIQEDV